MLPTFIFNWDFNGVGWIRVDELVTEIGGGI